MSDGTKKSNLDLTDEEIREIFFKKFLSFDFYLRQNEANKKSLKDLKNILNGRISTVVNNLVYLFKENNFTIEKRK